MVLATRINITGVGRARARIERKMQQVADGMAPAMQAIGDAMLSLAKSAVPVDEGALRDSLAMVVRQNDTKTAVVVGPDVDYVDQEGEKPADYAGAVEFGTRTNAAQPFLRPALVAVGQRVIDILGDKL